MSDERCENCRFYAEQRLESAGAEADGLCRRYPPTYTTMGTATSAYPPVRVTFWCGEWRETLDAIKKRCERMLSTLKDGFITPEQFRAEYYKVFGPDGDDGEPR